MVIGEFTESTQVAVIGAGPGGYVAAIRAAQLGKEVCLISDEAKPGGVCLQRGCIPSKAFIEASKIWEGIQGTEALGIKVDNPRIDFPTTQAWKTQVTDKLSQGVLQLLKQNGVQYVVGRASFQDEHHLVIQGDKGKQVLKFEHAIIATGSIPRPIKNFEYDEERILSSTGALALSEIPSSLLVVGGGYIGLELGGVFARLGSQVTIVEATDSLLPGLDKDLLRPLKKNLKKLNVSIHLNTFATSYENKGKQLEVNLKTSEGQEEKLPVEKILVAVGRQPNTEGLGLDKVGVEMDEQGYVKINDRCQTLVPHLYAIGDLAGGMMLAHKASREGKVAADHIAGGSDAFDNQVPAVIFTEPEIAYVGLQEAEAKAKGLEIITGMFSFAALGRAHTMNDTEGFVKVVAEKESGRLLGVQMVGPHVSDLISEATLGLEMGARLEDFALTIHPHPSLPEALEEAVESTLGMSIHRYQKRK